MVLLGRRGPASQKATDYQYMTYEGPLMGLSSIEMHNDKMLCMVYEAQV